MIHLYSNAFRLSVIHPGTLYDRLYMGRCLEEVLSLLNLVHTIYTLPFLPLLGALLSLH